MRHPALAAVEEELARTLAVAPLPEARRPASIAWATPSCPRAYQFDARVEMRLVGSSPGRHRAIDQELRRVAGDKKGIVAPLAPELVRAHGRDAIADLLRDHVRRLGPFVLGAPELASETQRDGDRLTARMTGSADGDDGVHGTVHTIVEAEVRDGAVVITRIATGLHTGDETSVLELSATRLHSADPR